MSPAKTNGFLQHIFCEGVKKKFKYFIRLLAHLVPMFQFKCFLVFCRIFSLKIKINDDIDTKFV